MAKKNISPRDKFIVDHTETLSWIIAGMITLWFFSGIFAIDYLHPVIVLVLWIPFGLAMAWWAKKW